MAKPEDIKRIIKELNPEAIFIKGFDKALYGTGRSIGGYTIAVYIADECLQILVDEHNMCEIEAWEHFNNTVVEGEQGVNKPSFISDWRWTVDIDQILKDIKFEKQEKLNDIIDQIEKEEDTE